MCARLSPRRFRISLLPASDDPWDGVAWLGSDSLNVYETQFRLSKLPSEATLYVCGLGFSSVSVNGFTLDAALVTAPWTANERLVGFSALDIHTFLRPDALNNLTISLGMGWRDQSAFGYIDGGELQTDKTARVLRAQLRTAPNTTLTHTVTHPRPTLGPPRPAPPRPRATDCAVLITERVRVCFVAQGDGTWKAAVGPVIYDSVYNGEVRPSGR